MKKCLSLLLVVLMVFAMGTTSFAADNGSITIDNAVVGETYTIYRLLDLESYDVTAGAYSYKANSAWETWLKTQTDYVTFDDQGYVTWKTGANAEDFAKAAKKYADDNSISSVNAATATTTTVNFTGLTLGYYLVDTTLGTLCSLDTTTPSVTIKEKNAAPIIDKKVLEDSNSSWGNSNDADIGDTIYFLTEITVKKGAENYVLHDVMSAGLKLNQNSISIAGLTKGTDYTVAFDVSCTGKDGQSATCDFHITFAKSYLDKITTDTKVILTYNAELTKDAVVVALPGNPNDTRLSYGDSTNIKYTPWDSTTTYTWDMEVLKYGNGKEENVLAGAKFVLLNKSKDKVATFETDGKFKAWVAIPTANPDGSVTWPIGAELTTGADGKIKINGLDADTYYLRETKAPDGFNKLASDEEVTITGATTSETTLTYTSVVKKINNQSGTKLPETGSTGTTIFVVVGSILALGALVFLITRKKMSIYEN